jgi:SAM-dependent methyltransferase
MTSKAHWDNAYEQHGSANVSWFRQHLDLSFDLIRQAAPSRDAAVIDVGGGASTLVDDLLRARYHDVTVLDLSSSALAVSKNRLGLASAGITWVDGDITQVKLAASRYDVWHDRAVFHFLTSTTERERYVAAVRHALKPGGHIIMATFALDGPEKCSGLPVARYGAGSLHAQFGEQFELLDSRHETHVTPSGKEQRFVYCFCRMR